MSPDDHYQDLKRIISAATGKARRINVIMPFLYESRQHKRTQRESLDCALALEELMAECEKVIITDKFCYQELENVEISESSSLEFENKFNK